MARNKLSKQLERIARETGLLHEPKLDKSPQGSNSVRLTMPPTVNIERPPSVNNLYISRGKHRVKSPRYREWLDKVIPVLASLPKPDRFPVRLTVRMVEKVHRGMDGDNTLKATIDAAVKAGVIPNDNLKYVTAVEFMYRPVDGMSGVCVGWSYDED